MHPLGIILLVCIIGVKDVFMEPSCYATNNDPYRRMGQKTSYFINENLDTSEIVVDGCEPRMLWYLGRHGARKPSRGEIADYGQRMPVLQAKILEAGALGQGEMCEDDYINIGEFEWHLTSADHKVGVKSFNQSEYGT